MARKKKYNPFKMVGSYVGTLIGFIWGAIDGCYGGSCDTISFLNNMISNYQPFFGLIIFIGSGFLIGWGIETLARKNKWFGLKKYP